MQSETNKNSSKLAEIISPLQSSLIAKEGIMVEVMWNPPSKNHHGACKSKARLLSLLPTIFSIVSCATWVISNK